jgi:galactokinase/mevalonate kinase-like predicted kinase
VISNPQIDQYYGICRKHGAGFKLIGSGSGGSILVVGGEQDKIREELGLIEIPFKITHEGSTVLYHE